MRGYLGVQGGNMEKTLSFQDLPKNFNDFLDLLRRLANDVDTVVVRFILFFDFYRARVQIDYHTPRLKDLIVFRSEHYILLYDKNSDEFFIPALLEDKIDYFQSLQQIYEIAVFKNGKYANTLDYLCQILFNCNLNVVQNVDWSISSCYTFTFDIIHRIWNLIKKEPAKIEMLHSIINDLQKGCYQ